MNEIEMKMGMIDIRASALFHSSAFKKKRRKHNRAQNGTQ